MWEDIRPLLSELGALGGKLLRALWGVTKKAIDWIAAAAVWSFKAFVAYCKLVIGLFTGHYFALAAMVLVLAAGYFLINALQKRKSFVYIPWYKEPLHQLYILVPAITLFLAAATNPAMSEVRGGGRFFIELFGNSPLLGPQGHLGVPTTIWAVVISFVFSVVAGSIALTRTERRKRFRLKSPARRASDQPTGRTRPVRKEPAPTPEDLEEAVILNEQPGWYEEKRKKKEENGEGSGEGQAP